MQPHPRCLRFYYPGKSFPALSITGPFCQLGCDYCRGHYLQGMMPVSDGQDLMQKARDIRKRGGEGFLLSGGCDRKGRVPLKTLIPTIMQAKLETGLEINLHTGLVDTLEEAAELVKSGVDCFSVDVVQDERIIREVMHLPRGKEDYARTLELLFEAGAGRVVPHVCLGLGRESSEEDAIELISQFPVSAIVLLFFMPAQNTPMAAYPTVSRQRALQAVRLAVKRVPAPVLLGCMRPRGDWKLEAECISEGVEGLAMPSRRTVQWAEGLGYKVEKLTRCCALHR